MLVVFLKPRLGLVRWRVLRLDLMMAIRLRCRSWLECRVRLRLVRLRLFVVVMVRPFS